MKKSQVGYFLMGLFVTGCIALGIYNFLNNEYFLNASLTTIISILIAVIVSYFFVQKKTDDRRKREKIDKLLYKIQEIISEKDFTTVKEGDLVLQRSIANKISYVETNADKEIIDDILIIRDNFERYREFYGNHYTDEDYMKKSNKEIMNYITLIDDTCDKIHMKLM